LTPAGRYIGVLCGDVTVGVVMSSLLAVVGNVVPWGYLGERTGD
jgi:hypothetical protein